MKRRERRVWSNEDVEYIVANYATMPNVDIAEHLGLDTSVVAKKAYDLGLKKLVKNYKNNWKPKASTEQPATQAPNPPLKQDKVVATLPMATVSAGVLPSNDFKTVRQYVLVAMGGLVNGQLSADSARLSLEMARFVLESSDVELAHQAKAQALFNGFVKLDKPVPAKPKKIEQPVPVTAVTAHPWRELGKQSDKTPSAIASLVNVPTFVQLPNIGTPHQHLMK